MTGQLGWLDTNVFVTLLFPADPHFRRCVEIGTGLRSGREQGWIDLLVVHELTYVLRRTGRFPDRQAISLYIREILSIESVLAEDKEGIQEALIRWALQGMSFADAWLAVQMERKRLPVCSINVKDFPEADNTFFVAQL